MKNLDSKRKVNSVKINFDSKYQKKVYSQKIFFCDEFC